MEDGGRRDVGVLRECLGDCLPAQCSHMDLNLEFARMAYDCEQDIDQATGFGRIDGIMIGQYSYHTEQSLREGDASPALAVAHRRVRLRARRQYL